jgi:hypothetical protein
MCYGIRAEQAEPGREGASLPSSGLDRMRPRVAGAVAALLVAGFAMAALVAPSPTMKTEQPAAAMLPVAGKMTVSPASLVEQTSTGMDDGVPTAMDTKRHEGDCHHGL